MAKAKLSGDIQLRNNLRRLGKVYTGRTLDEDIDFSLHPLVVTTENNAKRLRNYVGKYSSFFPQPKTPRKGGHLDEGVVSQRMFTRGQYVRTWWVAFKGRARKLAHLAEFGSSPHAQPNFRGGFAHPGARPKPFFRPAFHAEEGNVLGRLARRASLRISALALRLRK